MVSPGVYCCCLTIKSPTAYKRPEISRHLKQGSGVAENISLEMRVEYMKEKMTPNTARKKEFIFENYFLPQYLFFPIIKLKCINNKVEKYRKVEIII